MLQHSYQRRDSGGSSIVDDLLSTASLSGEEARVRPEAPARKPYSVGSRQFTVGSDAYNAGQDSVRSQRPEGRAVLATLHDPDRPGRVLRHPQQHASGVHTREHAGRREPVINSRACSATAITAIRLVSWARFGSPKHAGAFPGSCDNSRWRVLWAEIPEVSATPVVQVRERLPFPTPLRQHYLACIETKVSLWRQHLTI